MIDRFEGEYEFLSNFANIPVTIDGITYQNSEAAFQAHKTTDIKKRREFADLPPNMAKRMGRRIELRPDWEYIKNDIMLAVCFQKFIQDPYWGRKLVGTKDEMLIEGNTWNDTYWGVCNGVGENHLGKILMKVRDKLRIAFDAKSVKNSCVAWIRNWFEKNGKGCNAIVGISGGKDSSVVAALCVEALGSDRVIGVQMPNGVQDDFDVGADVIQYLNIKSYVINIEDAVNSIWKELKYNMDDRLPSKQTMTNLPARIRMATLYAVAQSNNGRVANTCNLSEDYIGYSTRYGDSVGDFSPLAKLTSDEVIAIGLECGLPGEFVYKVPSDGLCGRTDEENFGFSYGVLNRYIRTGICEDPNIKARIDNMHEKNKFKLRPMPTFDYCGGQYAKL